jgi:hypothetical protein
MKSKKPVFFIILAIALLMAYVSAYGVKINNFKILGSPDMRFGIDIKGSLMPHSNRLESIVNLL